MISNVGQKKLLYIARESLFLYFQEKKKKSFAINDSELSQKCGAFVTIKNKRGVLRGCIGIIENDEDPLYILISRMSIAAAFHDSRFPPINKNEINDLSFEISVLSSPKIIKNWQDIKLGKHGVIIEKYPYSGVFLPQVAAETAWSLEEFLENLCLKKAGLKKNSYKNDPEAVLKTFEAFVFSE